MYGINDHVDINKRMDMLAYIHFALILTRIPVLGFLIFALSIYVVFIQFITYGRIMVSSKNDTYFGGLRILIYF